MRRGGACHEVPRGLSHRWCRSRRRRRSQTRPERSTGAASLETRPASGSWNGRRPLSCASSPGLVPPSLHRSLLGRRYQVEIYKNVCPENMSIHVDSGKHVDFLVVEGDDRVPRQMTKEQAEDQRRTEAPVEVPLKPLDRSLSTARATCASLFCMDAHTPYFAYTPTPLVSSVPISHRPSQLPSSAPPFLLLGNLSRLTLSAPLCPSLRCAHSSHWHEK